MFLRIRDDHRSYWRRPWRGRPSPQICPAPGFIGVLSSPPLALSLPPFFPPSFTLHHCRYLTLFSPISFMSLPALLLRNTRPSTPRILLKQLRSMTGPKPAARVATQAKDVWSIVNEAAAAATASGNTIINLGQGFLWVFFLLPFHSESI